MGYITFSPSFALTQVTIPLGASNQNNPFSLSPSVLDIQVNDTVQWQNDDTAIHTVTTGKPHLGYDGRIDSGTISAGGTFSYKFSKTGVYEYYCIFHPWMTGLVNVGSNAPTQPTTGISISTDKPIYHTGDTILISGQVSRFVPNEQVTIWITNPQGRGISESHIETESGDTFSASVVPNGGLWIPGESYKVYAQYGFRSSVASATIQFEPESSAPTNVKTDTGSEITTSGQVSYMSAHKKVNADANGFVSTQTERNIYKPGEQVKIYGSIWNGLFQQLGGAKYLATVPLNTAGSNSMTELITVKVQDSNGTVISSQESQVDNNGDYLISFNLPQDSTGTFNVESMIETKAGVLNTLDLSTGAKLESSTAFAVQNPDNYVVATKEENFDVVVSSNSTVTNLAFNPDNKMISFNVQGKSGTRGITMITIPKALLSGQLQVQIDGIVEPYNSNDVIVSSETSAETTFEINYHHSTHVITVTGTQATEAPAESQTVPEFGSMATIALAISIILIITFSPRIRNVTR